MIRLALDFLRAPRRFKPTEILSSLEDLPLLARMKQAELIIFDKDDTLTRLFEFAPASPKVSAVLHALAEHRIRMLILSNSIRPGDPDNVAGVPILRTVVKKPFNEGEVRRAVGGVAGERVWLVGDRLMTDIYLANKVGIRSALVPPIEETSIQKHGVVVWALRGVERAYIAINGWK